MSWDWDDRGQKCQQSSEMSCSSLLAWIMEKGVCVCFGLSPHSAGESLTEQDGRALHITREMAQWWRRWWWRRWSLWLYHCVCSLVFCSGTSLTSVDSSGCFYNTHTQQNCLGLSLSFVSPGEARVLHSTFSLSLCHSWHSLFSLLLLRLCARHTGNLTHHILLYYSRTSLYYWRYYRHHSSTDQQCARSSSSFSLMCVMWMLVFVLPSVFCLCVFSLCLPSSLCDCFPHAPSPSVTRSSCNVCGGSLWMLEMPAIHWCRRSIITHLLVCK